jgi:hypothetical protein
MAERNLALSILINAKDQASSVLDGIKNKFSTFSGAVGALVAGLGAVGFAGFLKSTIDAADALDELSQKTGVSVRALAGLQRLPDLAEVPIENVGKAINKLSIYMAKNADEAVKMGISAQDPVDALYQFADVFASTESAQERAALGAKVLGKSYADLAPILLQGGDALRKQVDAFADQSGVTAEAAAQAGELNDKMANLSNAVKDFAGRAVIPSIGPLSELVRYLGDLFFSSEKAAGSLSGGASVYNFVAKAIGAIGLAVDVTGRGLGSFAAQLVALASLDFQGIADIDKAFSADNAAALEKYTQLLEKLNNPPAAKPQDNSGIKQITTDIDVALQKFQEWGAKSNVATEGVAAKLKSLSDIELRELKSSLVDAFESGVNSSKDLQNALDNIKTEEVRRAWETLGNTSAGSLRKAADEAKLAYVAIRDSGTASAVELKNAWSAVEAKLIAVADATKLSDETEKQRRKNLLELKQIGATPEELAYQRHKEIAQQTFEFDKAMRDGDFAEAARLAKEKEKLAFDTAKADTESAKSGEIASYNAYDAKQRYLRSIEDTKKALEALSQSEQTQAKSPDQQQQPDNLAAKQEELTKLQSTLDLLKQPVNLQVNANFAEAINAADQLQQRINALNTSIQNANASAAATLNGSGDSTAQTLSTEVLKRGSRT